MARLRLPHFHRMRFTGLQAHHTAGFKNGTWRQRKFTCRCGATTWRWTPEYDDRWHKSVGEAALRPPLPPLTDEEWQGFREGAGF